MSDTSPPADHAFVDDQRSEKPLEENLKSRNTWMRLLFMAIAYVLVSLASLVGSVVVVFGFFMVLFTIENLLETLATPAGELDEAESAGEVD